MKRFLIPFIMAAAMFTPTFAQEDNCFTPQEVEEAFHQIAAESGDTISLVHSVEAPDNSSFQFWYKGGETVLAILFNTDQCAEIFYEMTLDEFKSLTGLVLVDAYI